MEEEVRQSSVAEKSKMSLEWEVAKKRFTDYSVFLVK